MKASFPRTRRQRVDWLRQYRGPSFICGFEFKTDREVKQIFDSEYEGHGLTDDKIVDPGEIADELSL